MAFLNHLGTTGNPMKLALYGYGNTGTFGVLASLQQAQTTWSATGLFDLAAGDLTGESLRVGPPTYRRESSANNIVAILNTPPTHRDTLDGQEYVIGGDESYSIYETEQQTENKFSHTFTHNTSPGNICQSWYKPTHQVDNIWSYPLDKADFNGYVSGDAASHLYNDSITTGGAQYDWSHQMTENSSEQLTHSESLGVMAGLDVKAGGDEVTVKAGVLLVEGETKTRSPFISFMLTEAKR